MHLSLMLYHLAARMARPLVRRKLMRRAHKEPLYGQHIGQRFGDYRDLPPYLPCPDMPLVWIHAVSLGETRAAAILLRELRAQVPTLRLLLTHGTATGREEGRKLLLPGDIQVWQPWDDKAAVQAFLQRFRPAIGILIETEVWPALVAGCKHAQIPLVLANARLNEKSLHTAQRMAWLAHPTYQSLSTVIAQTYPDAQRLRTLGAPVQAILGNLKFDMQPDAQQLTRGKAWRQAQPKPVVLLASSREGEELLWLQELIKNRPQAFTQQALSAIKNEAFEPASSPLAAVQWLIVPRHPQRFDAVAQLLADAGLTVSRRSRWQTEPEPADIWLGDSMGEMQMYYGLADAALLGGSFAPLGGQNLIEAAACACPVVMGPHTFNFAQAAEASAQAGSALRVADMAQGLQAAIAIATDTQRQAAMAHAGSRFARSHSGAASASAQMIVALLESTEDFVNTCFEAPLPDEHEGSANADS